MPEDFRKESVEFPPRQRNRARTPFRKIFIDGDPDGINEIFLSPSLLLLFHSPPSLPGLLIKSFSLSFDTRATCSAHPKSSGIGNVQGKPSDYSGAQRALGFSTSSSHFPATANYLSLAATAFAHLHLTLPVDSTTKSKKADSRILRRKENGKGVSEPVSTSLEREGKFVTEQARDRDGWNK